MSLTTLLQSYSDEKEKAKKKAPEPEHNGYTFKDADGVELKRVLQSGRLKLLRQQEPRPQGLTFRPSSFGYPFCRRLKVLQLAGRVQILDKPPTPKLQLVFDMGHAIHDILQGYFWDLGMLKGSFKCLKCDKIYHELLAPTACPSGKITHTRKHLKYKEIVLKEPKYLISGRADGIVVIDGVEHLMDIKSIQNRLPKTSDRQFCFEDLEERGPKEDHIIQLILYMWISGIHRGHLVYVSKNDHQIRTYAIPYNFELLLPYLNEFDGLISLAERVKKGEKVELPVPCGREDCNCHTFSR